MNEEKFKFIKADNKTYPWYCIDKIAFRGYFFINGVFYSKNDAVNKILELIDSMGFDRTLAMLNGFFSIVYNDREITYFANDRLRAFPLFYSKINNMVIISSDINKIIQITNDNHRIRYNNESINEFKITSLFVSGEKTLINGIYQVEAGQIITLVKKTNSITKRFYFRYNHDNLLDISEKYIKNKLKIDFNSVYYEETGRDLVESLNGRTAVVPLSGGADSRMIVSMLNKFHYHNVICFTYGDIDSSETMISKKVASEYNFEWHFIKYGKKTWKWLKDQDIYNNYLNYGGSYTSCPHIQDFYAVYYLKREGIIPKDCVFIPGHSGDMLAGSHITKDFIESNYIDQSKLADLIIKKHYPYIDKTKLPVNTIKNDILKNLIKKEKYSSEEATNEYEFFDIIERQAKFICNSVRVYEFFGYEWRMPLWDNRLINFWSGLPIDMRYQRKFYFEAIGNEKIESTNDKTAYKNITAFIRNRIPFLRIISRYIFRAKDYYLHPFKWGQIVTFNKYLFYLLEGGEYFEINYIIMKEYLEKLGKNLGK
ncbi:asparagine synthase C-terminal domain-containing protein [Ruminiclostridium sufflavum]|nr:asparagine synthase C-terminal domain-containing protein [Ruminiclostridium sufflavum]